MTLDEDILKSAREAAARLEEAERGVTLAKADYHTMVRRLHLAGASLREIGSALSISHQRVQQIVEQAGGSWWTRMWKTRRPARDAVCAFCERPPSEVAKLLAGPDIHVCDACVAKAERALSGRAAAGWNIASERARPQCSFCGKKRARERAVVVAKAGNICGECLEQCRRILDAHMAPEPPTP